MQDVMHGRFEYAFLNKNKTIKAKDTATGLPVCIKKWRRGDSDAVNEIAVLASISCQGIPAFICSFEDEESKYLVEEWIEGVTLDEYLSTISEMAENTAIEILRELCRIVSYMHNYDKGYLHLDIKPSNIMISEDNKIYLLDFESARKIDEDNTQQNNNTIRLVSERFSAPEVYFSKPCIESDVYSIGKIAELLFNKMKKKQSLLQQIISKCVQFNVRDRYRNVEEIRKILENSTENNIDSRFDPITAYIDNNMCFTNELANMITLYSDLSVGIFALSEKGENRLIYYSMPGEYFSHRGLSAMSVCESSAVTMLPIINSYYEKNSLFYKGKQAWIDRKCLHRLSEKTKIYISGMNFIEEIVLNDYEEVQDFLFWCKENFDVTLVASDRNDDPSIDDIMCSLCDYIITTPQSNVDDVETAFQFFKTSAIKNGYSRYKTLFVAWDYDLQNSLPQESIKIMVGENQYLGAIYRTDYRQYRRNFVTDSKTDTKENIQEQYEKIIKRLLRQKEK